MYRPRPVIISISACAPLKATLATKIWWILFSRIGPLTSGAAKGLIRQQPLLLIAIRNKTAALGTLEKAGRWLLSFELRHSIFAAPARRFPSAPARKHG